MSASLPSCLPLSLHACLSPFMPASLPSCLPLSLHACLSPFMPASLPPCVQQDTQRHSSRPLDQSPQASLPLSSLSTSPPRPYGVEFLIETVLTPHRWSGFDAEMAASWKAVCLAVANTPLRESDLPAYRKAVQDSILRMAYYWYNFMPLARGTAMTGHVITLGLLLAIDLHASQPIPPAVQVDWESILCPSAALFLRSVSSWLYPSLIHVPRLKELLSVEDAFPSLGDVVDVLSAAVGEGGEDGGMKRGEEGGVEGGEEERQATTGGDVRPGGTLEGKGLTTGGESGESSSSVGTKMVGNLETRSGVAGGYKVEGGEGRESKEREESRSGRRGGRRAQKEKERREREERLREEERAREEGASEGKGEEQVSEKGRSEVRKEGKERTRELEEEVESEVKERTQELEEEVESEGGGIGGKGRGLAGGNRERGGEADEDDRAGDQGGETADRGGETAVEEGMEKRGRRGRGRREERRLRREKGEEREEEGGGVEEHENKAKGKGDVKVITAGTSAVKDIEKDVEREKEKEKEKEKKEKEHKREKMVKEKGEQEMAAAAESRRYSAKGRAGARPKKRWGSDVTLEAAVGLAQAGNYEAAIEAFTL
ncbi:unnamed protein product, partial [Closterium sp. NIES-54]